MNFWQAVTRLPLHVSVAIGLPCPWQSASINLITFFFSFFVHFFSLSFMSRSEGYMCWYLQQWQANNLVKYHQHIDFNLLRQSLHKLVTGIAKRNGANFVACGIPPRSYSLHSTCQKRSDPANDSFVYESFAEISKEYTNVRIALVKGLKEGVEKINKSVGGRFSRSCKSVNIRFIADLIQKGRQCKAVHVLCKVRRKRNWT